MQAASSFFMLTAFSVIVLLLLLFDLNTISFVYSFQLTPTILPGPGPRRNANGIFLGRHSIHCSPHHHHHGKGQRHRRQRMRQQQQRQQPSSSSLFLSRIHTLYLSPDRHHDRRGQCQQKKLHRRRQQQRRQHSSCSLFMSRDYVDRGSYWVYMYYLLMIYRDRENDVNDMPYSHVEDGWPLGEWLSHQKKLKRNGQLDPIYQKRLDDAGVKWENQYEHKWNIMYERLLNDFKLKYGHCNVQQKDGELGRWLHAQRTLYSKGILKIDRRNKLEKAGVVFNAHEYHFEKMYKLLLVYKERNGHCNVKVNHIEEDENLGSWLATQRRLGRSGSLDTARQRRLEEAGVVFDVMSDHWDYMFDLLVQYKERTGDCRVRQNHKEKGKNLGTWLMNQKTDKITGKLEKSRKERLEAAGVTWRISHSDRWDKMYLLLVEFYIEHDKLPTERYVVDGTKLGVWLKNQKEFLKKGILDESRRERLEKVGLKLPAQNR